MPRFGRKSLSSLLTLELELQEVLQEAIKHFDFSIVSGHRGEEEQNALYNAVPKRSKAKYPHSAHNSYPSKGVDIVPYPIDWEDRERFTYLAGLIQGIAKMKGIEIKWGGDWDRDTEVKDNDFDDLSHFELIG